MTKSLASILLAVSICLEVFGGTMLKFSEGNTKWGYTVLCLLAYVACFLVYSRALPALNMGIAYATWCGCGIVAMTLISSFLFNERITPVGIGAVLLIIAGVVLLNLYGKAS